MGPGQGQAPQMRVNFEDTKPIQCHECGSDRFSQVFLMRFVSAVISPYGQEQIMPVPIFECSHCGEVLESSLPRGYGKDETDNDGGEESPKVELP